jgi:2-polyprenyl-3-methyl-5-hydroxy-6-metoxy-1,4-benzoquinol methylase
VTENEQKDAFAGRLLSSLTGAFDIFSIYLGDRLGYYDALTAGPMTSAQLAARTSTHERYAREWLEQQATAGILTVDDPAAAPGARRFALPPGHAEVLTDRDSLDYMAPIARLFAGAVSPLARVLQAYRTGAGVPYADYGPDLIEGQGAINRAAFLQQLGSEWLPAMPDVHARLQARPPARVADVGCGVGWSSIGVALAYPNARVDGFDLDASSIELARANARDAGVDGRVAFEVRDAADAALAGRYDLILACECVHDMSDPVGALRAMCGLASDGGAVLVVDERVAEELLGEGNDVEQIMYGWSVLHCLPAGMADQPSAATGTVMRPEALRRYASGAGFSAVDVLPVDNLFFRLYRLTP